MIQIVIDPQLREKLQHFVEPVELCDESGRVVARVVPVLDPSQYEAIEPKISAEELARRRAEPDYSTAEVLDYLEKL